MQNGTETRSTEERWAIANGHLLEAADAAEKLTVVVNYIREIVRGRINPAGLIGIPMAEAVEEFSTKIAAAIRKADDAKEGRL
jgi:hypothetical protein